jgi:hypothetical protein
LRRFSRIIGLIQALEDLRCNLPRAPPRLDLDPQLPREIRSMGE